jgi:hypothetical protein
MKKIVLFFNISAAIFLLNSFSASGAERGFCFKEKLYASTVYSSSSSSDNLLFDFYFADVSDDNDDSNDSEDKKMSSGKATKSNTTFWVNSFLYNKYTIQSHFPLHFFRNTSLFIFFRVLRL